MIVSSYCADDGSYLLLICSERSLLDSDTSLPPRMNPQHTNPQGYPSSYITPNHQHSTALSAALRSSTTTTTATQRHVSELSPQDGSHTLAPIAASHYPPALGQPSFTSRAQPLQPSLAASGPNPPYQHVYHPVYGPTSQTYFSSDCGSVTPYSQPATPQQAYRTSTTPYQLHQPQPGAAPFPSTNQSARLPDLRPMPVQTLSAENYGTSKIARPLASAKLSTEDAQPIHVVGSQGRRGILPSAAGRPPAVGEIAGGSQKGVVAPPKDPDGKYPCEHCPKTYLHAKHLKRHMLRRESTTLPFDTSITDFI